MKRGGLVVVVAVVLFMAGRGNAQWPCTEAVFGDVNNVTQPSFCGWVEQLYTLGITGGCRADDPATPENERMYCPESLVTRGQMAVLLTKAIESYGVHSDGSGNFFAGISAGNSTMSGVFNSGSGMYALHSNTTGNANTASGANALNNNTTGDGNTASGSEALFYNTTGTYNTASGVRALFENTTGDNNTASGAWALNSNQTGTYNTASGAMALSYNTTGNENAAFGYSSLGSNLDGHYNTAVGTYALANSLGFGNTALGHNAGFYNRDPNVFFTGSNNIFIGNDVGSSSSDESGTIRIGGIHQSQAFIAGIYGAAAGGGAPVYVNSAGQLGTSTSSRRYKEEIQDMGEASSGLMQLRPVIFRYKSEYAEEPRTLQYGLIAEEVAKVYPDLVMYDPATGRPQTVHYHHVNAMLLNEVQKQQRVISTLQKAVDEKDARIEKLEKDNERIVRALERLAMQVAAIEGSTKSVALK